MLPGPCTPQRDAWKMAHVKSTFQNPALNKQIRIEDDGYPEYARPDNGHAVQKNKTT